VISDPRGPAGSVPGDLVGRTLGDFVVRAPLGEGGHGVVYRAEQPALGREAVIKVIQTKLQAQGELVQRFLREARLASKLDHPYAAHVYAFGAEGDGLLWIAMELVRGTPLDKVLAAQGPMPLERFVPFFERLCEVVHTAHEQGIVHRDLKPANVMVIARAGRVLPKLLDLGIAKATDAAGEARLGEEEAGTLGADVPAGTLAPTGGETAAPRRPTTTTDLALTQRGEVIGSPRYMAPEQWVNIAVDARTDIYSLGVVAYELLTGRRPFAGATMKALAKAHARNPVPPLGEGFPPALHDALSRAMAKKAVDRPATAIELAAAVRAASGLEAEREALPRLDEETRASALTEAPQPLADAVAALDQARNGHQLREALWEVVAVLCHLLGVLVLASRSRLARRPDSELLLALTRRSLSDAEWLELGRELVRPFAQERDAFPVPELATYLLDGVGELEAMATAERTGSFSEEQLRPILVKQMAALGRVLRAVGFLSDYRLVTGREDGAVDVWAGTRRAGARVVELTSGSVLTGGSALIDAGAHPVLLLSPLLQRHAPTPGATEEMFLFAGKGRRGARLVAPPRGFERSDEDFWPWFREHLFAGADAVEGDAPAETTPYRGLASFTRDDAALFFGREEESDAFLNRLRITPLLAVVGPSGAGKSSFVEAGVVPNLPRDTLALRVRPGPAPLATLQARLAAERELTGGSEMTDGSVGQQLRALARACGAPVLLIVDQAEELFTLCLDEAERRAYARELVDAARSAEEPVRVVLTLRDDFLVRATELGAFRDRIGHGLQILSTPAREDLLRIVSLPAERAGYRFEDPDLPARMVDAVAGQPGALALLSFTAARLWELRDRHFKQLPRKAYEAIGGVAGALAQHAEAVREELPVDEQRLLRDAFRALVTSEGTRAVLRRQELLEVLGASSAAARVIDRLVDARLLVTGESESGPTVEVIHEALLSAWPRLVEWRREDAEGARLRDQLRAASRQWEDRARAPGLLWRGDALVEYQRWRTRYPGQLSASEAAFGDASTAEANRARRNRRLLLGGIFAGLSAALAIALVLRSEATTAQSRAEAAQAQTEQEFTRLLQDLGRRYLLDDDVLRAWPYLSAVAARGERNEALAQMIGRARRMLQQQVAVLRHDQPLVNDVQFTHDGAWIVSGGADQRVSVWGRDGTKHGSFDRHRARLLVIAPSPHDPLIASSDFDGTTFLWDIDSRQVVDRLPGRLGGVALDFSPSGRFLASGSKAGVILVWDTVARRAHRWYLGHRGYIRAVRFVDDGTLISAGSDGRVLEWRLDGGVTELAKEPAILSLTVSPGRRYATWFDSTTGEVAQIDLSTRKIRRVRGHSSRTYWAVSSDDGEIQTVGEDGAVLIWGAASPPRATPLVGHRGPVFFAALSPNGERLVTTSAEGTAIVWDRAKRTPLQKLSGHTALIRRAVFDPRGELIATAALDGTARLWRPGRVDLIRQIEAHKRGISRVSMSDDGRWIAAIDVSGALGLFESASLVEVARTTIDVKAVVDTIEWSPGGQALLVVDDYVAKLLAVPGLEARPLDVGKLPKFGRWLGKDDALFVLEDGSTSRWTSTTGATAWTPPPASVGQDAASMRDLRAPIRDASADPSGFVQGTLSGDVYRYRVGAATPAFAAKVPAAVTALRLDSRSGKTYVGTSSNTIFTLSAEGNRERSLEGHAGDISAFAILGDGRLASASLDGTAKVWDLRAGVHVATFRGSGNNMTAIAAAPDGRLVTGDTAGRVAIWDASTGAADARADLDCLVPYELQGSQLTPVGSKCGQ
jgi:WD40 repeat protein/serine/threonine protein kinase